ncbi:hypothetical protein BJF77_07945 [Kocuria sp. CNJ-770]|uniref:hypothetical protein n=1 Tax=Kocuria sp. CNJ-770 TaxID=1904964 RepID=UPI000960B333|nr:hypothetical protein [Kocuria sp. CNJ-770]OLT10667.1 hypothetical protein BJF77_07945 [Kocuria sp. CNJ-770]
MSSTRAPEPLGGISMASRSPLADSRELAAVSGALYPVLTLLVRLPQTMVPLGVLTTVALISGSPALGTLCAGAVTLGSAVCGLAMGAAASWRGRQLGLVLLTLANPVAVWWLVRLLPGASAAAEPDPVRLVLPCLLAGLVLPQMGVVCRLRWWSLLGRDDRQDLFDTALRHESVMDSLATVLAAVVTGLVAVTLGPAAVLALSAALTLAGTTVFLLHCSARLPRRLLRFRAPAAAGLTRAARLRRRRIAQLRLLPVVGMGTLGALLGSILGSVVVFAISVDAVVSVAWLYAVTGLTSAVAAVFASARTEELRLWNRWVGAASGAVLASMLLTVPDDSVGMVLALAVAGLTTGPCLVAVYELARLVAPSSRVTALTTVMTAAMSVGMTVGLVLSGWFGETWGYRTAALVPVGSAALLLAGALGFVHRWRRTLLDDT